jgi:hypothetical protein
MGSSLTKRNLGRLLIIFVSLFAFAALSTARSFSTSVNIVNNSSREIRSVYLSSVNADDWSGNQLGTATIPAGQSFTLSNVECGQQQVKVIAEDQDGCFETTVISCGSNGTWTITNDTARDCGAN